MQGQYGGQWQRNLGNLGLLVCMEKAIVIDAKEILLNGERLIRASQKFVSHVRRKTLAKSSNDTKMVL